MTVLTDFSSVVEGEFDSVDCCINPDPFEHGGSPAAYVVAHDCLSGVVCDAHYQIIITRILPQLVDDLENTFCTPCGKYFPTVDDFVKVYPL